MTQELARVLVRPDESCPLERAQALIEPFLHEDHCVDSGKGHCEDPLWNCACVGGLYYVEGCLWRDRYGRLPEDHPITCPSDEMRKASDIEIHATFLTATALIRPDGQIHHVREQRHPLWESLADYAAYEDRLAEYPECYAVPFRCCS